MLQQLIDAKLLPPKAFQDRIANDRYYLPPLMLEGFAFPSVVPSHGVCLEFIISTNNNANSSLVTACLSWGKGACKVRLQSGVHENYAFTLADLLALVKQIPDDILTLEITPWAYLVGGLDETRKKLPFSNIKVENVVDVGLPQFVCIVDCKGKTYRSAPSHTKMKAIDSLVVVINEAAELTAEKPEIDHAVTERNVSVPPSKKKVSTPIITTKPTSPIKKEIELLHLAIKKWRAEYSWLLSQKKKNTRDEERIHNLSRYLTVSDPLRWYELGEVARMDVLNKMEQELALLSYKASKSGQKKQIIQHLRSMVVNKTLCPGDELDSGLSWRDKVYRNGDDPKEVIQQILSLKLIRQGLGEGKYTLSNRGVSLVEKYLKDGYPSGTIGGNISLDKLFSILQSGRK
jgi:hypothetical protein